MSRTSRRTGRAGGFTLIELLVVISIVALLLAILLPALASVRNSAVTLRCQSNLQQIGRAMYAYKADHNGYVMRDSSTNRRIPGNELWAAAYSPYLGGPAVPTPQHHWNETYLTELMRPMEVFRCPAIGFGFGNDHVLHYVINACNYNNEPERNPDGTWSTARRAYVGITRVEALPHSPSALLYITEGNFNALRPDRQFFAYDIFRLSHMPFSRSGNVHNNPRMIHAHDDRHQGRLPILFFDSHVELRHLEPDSVPPSLMLP